MEERTDGEGYMLEVGPRLVIEDATGIVKEGTPYRSLEAVLLALQQLPFWNGLG